MTAWRARAGALLTVIAIASCSTGGGVRPLRIAVMESGGDVILSLEEPVRAVVCVIRDYRRAPSDPAAVRPIWTARCTAGADCRTAVRYDDASLEPSGRAERLQPSEPGTCYECELTGDHGRGLTRFRVTDRGGFESCRPGTGTL